MRISHKHKFIFIATPKTGSTSIRSMLDEFSDIKSEGEGIYQHHTTYAQALKRFDYAKDYTCFAFVRNPWDRWLSLWYYIQRQAKIGKGKYSVKCKGLLKKHSNFKEYVMNITAEKNKDPMSAHNCFKWISSDGEHVDIDYVGKMETMQEDFDTICDKIGIPRQTLLHKNATTHKHYTKYYDDEMIDTIAQKCEKDIEHFGYKFGE